MGVHREIWNRKYRTVTRDSRGRLLTHKKYDKKTFSADKRLFKHSKIIKPGVKVNVLTNVKEVINRDITRPKGQYAVEITYKFRDGAGRKVSLTARSDFNNSSLKDKRDEVELSSLERVSEYFNPDDYDAVKGKYYMSRIKHRKYVRVVYYQSIKKDRTKV